MVGGRLGDETTAPDSLDKADLREAYERGRRDERARRKRHPIGMTLTFAAAFVGVVMLGLALVNGSFAAAGQTVDQQLTIAKPAASQAASTAGQQLRDAADQAKTKASDVAS
jgi:hypothetical protein